MKLNVTTYTFRLQTNTIVRNTTGVLVHQILKVVSVKLQVLTYFSVQNVPKRVMSWTVIKVVMLLVLSTENVLEATKLRMSRLIRMTFTILQYYTKLQVLEHFSAQHVPKKLKLLTS